MTDDELEIRAVVERYFYALDSREIHLLTSCFTGNAVISFEGVERVLDGPEDVVAAFAGIRQMTDSSHLRTSQHVEVAGDGATSHTFALAFVVGAAGDGRVHVRGIQYRDQLVRTPEGWRIATRVHSVGWQFDADSIPPAVLGGRWRTTPA